MRNTRSWLVCARLTTGNQLQRARVLTHCFSDTGCIQLLIFRYLAFLAKAKFYPGSSVWHIKCFWSVQLATFSITSCPMNSMEKWPPFSHISMGVLLHSFVGKFSLLDPFLGWDSGEEILQVLQYLFLVLKVSGSVTSF